MHDKPKILLATTCRWFSAARLGLSFASTSCLVEAVSPSGHPLELTNAAQKFYRFDAFTPGASLRAAIEKSQPDLVIPCDDVAAIHLRRVCAGAAASSSGPSRALFELLTRSMGELSSYPILSSRVKFLALSRELGIRTPSTEAVDNEEEARAWCDRNGFPAVLKADGTSGGRGVRIAQTMEEALAAFRTLDAPVPISVVLKRAGIDRDLNLVVPWLKRKRNVVSIQEFVTGTDFNIAVACWKGEVVASVGAEVLQTWQQNGPASVIRLVPDGDMLRMAQAIVHRLQLSGLCGFDFLVNAKTGEHTLIEINPRATQTGHIPLGPGHDLPSALYSAMTGKKREPMSVTGNDRIALFPLAWQSNPPREQLESAYQDIPREAPGLVQAGEAETDLLSRAKWKQLWIKAWGPGWGFRLSRRGSS
jgi:glutathione synthase/RimK-type ligase-like ATP-grasp enzyme